MDPEEIRQWLASVDSYGQPLPEVEPFRRLPGMPTSPDPTRFFAQQDATAPQTRGRPRSFIEMLRNAGEAFGKNTLGRALTLGTTDPRLPETQQAYRTALGLGADLAPVIGAGKASFIDAPELFREGRPIAGALTFASGAIGPALGLPRTFARLMKPFTRVAPEALGAAAEAAPTIVRARHYGAGARAERLLVGRQGSGRPGTESVNDAQQPRTYFYLPEVLEAQTGKPFRPEPQFAGDPSVDLDLDIGNFVNAEGQKPYYDLARSLLRAEKAAGPNPNINPEPMPMDVQNFAEEMMIADGATGVMDETRGVAAKFSDTELPRGRANREIIEATDEFDGATFSTEGDNLAGQPLYATARPAPGGRKDWKTLPEGEALTPAHLNAFRKEFADELSHPEASIGTWHDKATGRVAIDVVETIPDRAEAIRRGKERGQDAIFDLGAMEEIGVADDVDPLAGAMAAEGAGAVRRATQEERALFLDLANQQRDVPERAMRDVQRNSGGGVLDFLAEHVGDLSHRLSQFAGVEGFTGREVARQNILDKTRKTLKLINSEYGVEREVAESVLSNARFRGVSLGEYNQKLDNSLSAYAEAHKNLPAYNEMQELARDAAVAIGEKDFEAARRNLTRLEEVASDASLFNEKIYEINTRSLGGASQMLEGTEQFAKKGESFGSRTPTPAGLADAPSPQRQLQSEETAQAVVASVPDADAAIASLPARLGARLTARQRRSTEGRSVASRARRAQEIKSGLTPDELAAYNGANVGLRKRIESAYSSLPTPEVFAQAAIRGAQSRGWYLGSGRAIRQIFGQDAPRMTALIAAQSPNKSVEDNLRFSLQTWENWNAAGRPTDPDELRRLSPRMRVPDPLKPGRMKSVPTPDAIIQSPLPADFENSITALSSAEDVLAAGNPELLSGPKVGPFYANLLGAVDPVTNDTHMARGYGTLPGGVGTKARTLAQNAMIGNAARAFEEATGVAVDRREIQEMSWAYIRGLTNASAGGSALETIEKAILDPSARFAGGRTVQEQVENSVSMGHLMNEPRFAQQLERMGLRAPAKPQGPIGVEGLDPLSADPNALRELGERIDIVREATRRKKRGQKGPLAKGLFSLAGAGLGLDAANREPRR